MANSRSARPLTPPPARPPKPPHQPQDFYGAAEEVALPFDQEEGVSDLSTWSKKM